MTNLTALKRCITSHNGAKLNTIKMIYVRNFAQEQCASCRSVVQTRREAAQTLESAHAAMWRMHFPEQAIATVGQ
jgi:hypothetical protein